MNESERPPRDLYKVILTEVNHAPRSCERVLELSIQNLTKSSVRLVGMDQYFQQGVRLPHLEANSFLLREQEYRQISRDLNIAINDELFFNTEGLIEARKEQIAALIDGAIGGSWETLSGTVRNLIRISFRPYTRRLIDQRFMERYHASRLQIDNYEDAERGLKLLRELQIPLAKLSSIEARLGKLEALERAKSQPALGAGGVEIESGTVFSEQYVIVFPRAFLESRSYSISFVVKLAPQEAEPIDKKASLSISVTASSWVLSVIAVVFSLAGMASRLAIDPRFRDWRSLSNEMRQPEVLLAVLVGFLVFNVYETLALPDRAKAISPNWRTAALIGFCCGLATDNFLNALRGFFGFQRS